MQALYDPKVADAILQQLFWGAKFKSDIYTELRAEFGVGGAGQPHQDWQATLEALYADGLVRRTSSGRIRKVRSWEAKIQPKVSAAAVL